MAKQHRFNLIYFWGLLYGQLWYNKTNPPVVDIAAEQERFVVVVGTVAAEELVGHELVAVDIGAVVDTERIVAGYK